MEEYSAPTFTALLAGAAVQEQITERDMLGIPEICIQTTLQLFGNVIVESSQRNCQPCFPHQGNEAAATH